MPKGHHHGSRYKCLVKIASPNACWQWLGSVSKRTGYGKKQWCNETWLAHRWIWTMLFGSIPKGLTINHKCRNRSCVNPNHLELVTQTENCRHGKGTKLSEADVRKIRKAKQNREWGDGVRLAKEYGVTSATIHDIWSRRSWSDL